MSRVVGCLLLGLAGRRFGRLAILRLLLIVGIG